MKTIYFDSIGGASGDMILACLLDLGADLQAIESGLKKIVKDRFSIEARRIRPDGFGGVRVTVKTACHNAHGHHHRNLKDIEQLICAGKFPVAAKARALAVFRRLAKAEAKVHGVQPDKIHFHEVGALDSIIDIIGACIALEQLGAEQVAIGPLPLGHGTIKCAHGILPSPAPATVELLKGFAVEQTDEPFELVTPTGAALLTTLQNVKRAPAGAVLKKVGCGYGHFKLNSRPNLLRAIMFDCDNSRYNLNIFRRAAACGAPSFSDQTASASRGPTLSDKTEQCLVLECNLDDTTPEMIGNLSNRLLAKGALDVFITPVQMKKNRPGAILTVLCSLNKRDEMLDLIFRESTTFGVREHDVRRTILPRRFETVKTPYGAVRVKIGAWQGKEITRAPEYEDCRKLAEKAGIPLRMVYEAAQKSNKGKRTD